MREQIEAAAEHVLDAIDGDPPQVAIVLGSGLSVEQFPLQGAKSFDVGDIPHLPVPAVAGHSATWSLGEWCGKRVLLAGGRVHGYEGIALSRATLGVRVMARIGCHSLIVTNAAGGIREDLEAGKLMRIRDHINMLGDSPLVGVRGGEGIGQQFVDMTEAYDKGWGSRVTERAHKDGLELHVGVYAACLGPQYETPAEVELLARLGVDAVGMSTVPEVIVARQCGMKIFGLSLISNAAAGRSPHPLSHQEVIEAGEKAREPLLKLLALAVTESL